MRHWLMYLPALAVCALATHVFWRGMGAPVTLPDVPGGRLQCLSYTAFEPRWIGYHPQGVVPAGRIEADMAALAPLTGCLRIYSARGPAEAIVQAARPHGLQIILGAWLGGRTQAAENRLQIEAALDLARRYPDTVRMIVAGNEVLLRREMTGAELARLIREIRTASPVPVAYADVDHFIRENPEVAAAVDVALIHILPYWIDPVAPHVDTVIPYIEQRVAEFRARFPGKDFMIGETGWPSAGRRRGQAEPGRVNQARLLRTFANRAEALGLRYNLIEAIDQPWKRVHEGTVGGYWGVLDQYRAPKFALAGPVSEWPHWRSAWLAGLGAGAVLLLVGARRRIAGVARWSGLVVLGSALALTLPLQWDLLMTTSQTPAGALARLAGLLASLAAAGLLAGRLTGSARVAPASMPDVVRALRKPSTIARHGPLQFGLLQAIVLPAAAYIGINLALAPRHLDVPSVMLALPVLALVVAGFGVAAEDRREEALLAVIVLISGLLQTEASNPSTWGWTALSILLCVSQRRAIGAELRRLRRQLLVPEQA